MKKVKLNYSAIPVDLKRLNRWACFDIEDGEKKPFTPGSNEFARPNDVSTLRPFKDAVQDVKDGHRDHIAFCFQEDDPYTFLDLDHTDEEEFRKEHELLLLDFQSYTERSVSGAGLHIIVKGKLDGKGMHADYVQVWDRNRFCIMTGHVIKGRSDINIATKANLKKLSTKIKKGENHGKPFDIEEYAWDYSHYCLFYTACANVFKQKFINLYHGDWLGYREYQDRVGNPDHSKADHALISMMCELTESNELVRYAFHESNLFREWKHPHDPIGYVDRSIIKYRQKVENQKVLREEAKQRAKKNVERQVKAKKAVKKKTQRKSTKSYSSIPEEVVYDNTSSEYVFNTDKIDAIPSNLLRRLAMWNTKNSRIPQQEFSIAGALVQLTSVIQHAVVGPSNTGCNMNLWVLAPTGTGKDTFIGCIERLANELKDNVRHYKDRLCGKFSSGEALDTVLSGLPMFISKVPEAGAWWRKLLSPQRPPHIDTLAQGMMELFTATSPTGSYQTRKKAKQDENLRTTIFRPAASFFGESTQEDFFKEFDIHNIDTGLLQRQLVLDLNDLPFVEINEKHSHPMSRKLKNDIIKLITMCDQMSVNNKFHRVPITARALARIQDLEHDLRVKRYKEGVVESLESKFLSRSVIKIYRLATLLAVSDSVDNYNDAVVNDTHMQWAMDFILTHDNNLVNKLNSGEVSSGQIKQEVDILKVIQTIVSSSKKTRENKYKFAELVAQDTTLVTYAFVKMRCKRLASFRSDRRGGIVAIDAAIDSLCKAGVLSRLTKHEAQNDYETSANLLRFNGES